MVLFAEPVPSPPVTGREPLLEIDGEQILIGLRNALAWLQANEEQVNDLNVFPVPDGDTGSNMYLTVRSAVEEAQRAVAPESAGSVLAAAAHGSLMGARGNSGVILSQVFRGFAQSVGGQTRLGVEGLAAGLEEAAAVAYRAVMKPTEGTILTVARDAAAGARAAASASDDLRVVLETAAREAHAAVERTTDQLTVLRDAGVVDAGGFGLAVVLEGFARALADTVSSEPSPRGVRRGGEPRVRSPFEEPDRSPRERRGAASVAPREEGWGHCTEFLIHGAGLDVDSLRLELGALGDSTLIVGDSSTVRVHIHTADPASLIAAAAGRGRLSQLKVEDMSAQHHEILDRAHVRGRRKPLGIVSVAAGPGFREILRSVGSDVVVEGGQTMNPSIEDLLMGVRQAQADAVILLPNNGNVILTAQQVNDLVDDVEVIVVPTRNLPQGISALLALEPDAAPGENAQRMLANVATVRAIEVTRAVRDSVANGRAIRTGDVIALVDDEIAEVGSNDLGVIEAVLAGLPSPPELVTVYHGAGVAEGDAAALVDSLQHRHPRTEFEVHNGGQEHYPYVLSLE